MADCYLHDKVLEAQIAAIRYELGTEHSFDFAEGTVVAQIAPEIKGFYPEKDVYFDYFERSSAASLQAALANLSTFLALEGPYDAILGFSMGAGLAATYLIRCAERNPKAELPVKCAVFFSGQTPWDLAALNDGRVTSLDPASYGSPLKLPTANIWGHNDTLHSGAAEALSQLCDQSLRNDFVHEEGHDIPSARAKSAVLGSVKAIRRTIDKALSL